MQKLQFEWRARTKAGEEDTSLAVIPSCSHTGAQDSTCGCHMSRWNCDPVCAKGRIIIKWCKDVHHARTSLHFRWVVRFETEGGNSGCDQVTAVIVRFSAWSLEHHGASLVLTQSPVACQALRSLRRAFDVSRLLRLSDFLSGCTPTSSPARLYTVHPSLGTVCKTPRCRQLPGAVTGAPRRGQPCGAGAAPGSREAAGAGSALCRPTDRRPGAASPARRGHRPGAAAMQGRGGGAGQGAVSVRF